MPREPGSKSGNCLPVTIKDNSCRAVKVRLTSGKDATIAASRPLAKGQGVAKTVISAVGSSSAKALTAGVSHVATSPGLFAVMTMSIFSLFNS